MLPSNLYGLILELLLEVIDQASTLNIFAFLDNDTTSVLANTTDFGESPELTGNPAIALVLGIRLNVIWFIQPTILQEFIVFIGVIEFGKLAPLGIAYVSIKYLYKNSFSIEKSVLLTVPKM
jgi:hypothetical protein